MASREVLRCLFALASTLALASAESLACEGGEDEACAAPMSYEEAAGEAQSMKMSMLQRPVAPHRAEGLSDRRAQILAELQQIDVELGQAAEGLLQVADKKTYRIKNIHSKKCMDTRDGTHKLELMECDDSQHQKWHYHRGEIQTKNGKNCVTITGAVANGAKVKLDECQGKEKQQWLLSPKGWFKSKASSHFCIDVEGDMNTADGATLQLGKCMLLNILSDQRWELEEWTPTAAPTPQPTRHPTPHPTHRPTPHPTHRPTPHPTPTPTDDPKYTIQHITSKRCMDTKGNSNKLQLWDCDNSKGQIWHFTDGQIQSKNGKMCATIKGGVADGAKVHLEKCEGKKQQEWELSPKGWFKSKVDRHMCIDVEGSMTTANGATLQLGKCMLLNLFSDQRWELLEA